MSLIIFCITLLTLFSGLSAYDFMETVEDYVPDFLVDEINQTNPLTPRSEAIAGSNSDYSQVFLLGGSNFTWTEKWIWNYNVDNNAWTNTTVPFSRTGACAAQDGQRNGIWIFGGDTRAFQQFIFSPPSFNTFAPPPEDVSISNAACAVTDSGDFYALFGDTGLDTEYDALNCSDKVYVWTADKNWSTFTANGTAPPPLSGASAVFYTDSASKPFIIVFGGSCDSNDYNEIYRLDLDLKNWTKDTPKGDVPPLGRSSASVFLLGDNLVVFGGKSKDNIFFNDAYVYNLVTSNWTKITVNSAYGRYKSAVVSLQNRGFIFGGESVQGETVKYYDDLHQIVYEGSCLGATCEDCTSTRVGCGWCNANKQGSQCVTGDSAPYVPSYCNASDTIQTYITDLDFCPQLFPSYAIALLVIGGVVVVGIVIFAIMKVRSGDEKPGYERIS